MESITCSNTSLAAGVAVWSMTDAQLVTALRDTDRHLHQLEEHRLRLIREADARNLAGTAGAASTAQWVAGQLRMPHGEAGGLVKLARHVDTELPATADALASGEISLAHARVISRTVQHLPSEASTPALRTQVEATMVAQAKTFDPPTLAKIGHRVLDTVDPDLADRVLEKQLHQEEARAHRDRYLRMSWDATSGTWRVAARLPKLVGERLKLVLDPLAAPQTGPDGRDTRTPEQRHCDALDEAARRLLADQLVPSHGGNPTQLVVTVTRTGGRTLHTGIDLSRKVVEQLACEADRAVLVTPEVRLVEERLYTKKLRRLLELRDGGCAFPGCDRPPGWCHAHHIVAWSKGGPTTADNGVLLCGYHHRLIHQGEWTVHLARDGLPDFTPPDWIDTRRQPLRNHRLAPAA